MADIDCRGNDFSVGPIATSRPWNALRRPLFGKQAMTNREKELLIALVLVVRQYLSERGLWRQLPANG
jgi:hypothetical protein